MNRYNFNALPDELKAGAEQVISLLEINRSEDGVKVTAVRADNPSITRRSDGVVIGYNKKCEFFRMLGLLDMTEGDYRETPRHTSLCYMADQSRNAVFTPETARRLLVYLASLGYDSFMLYTEDTYEIEGEPYFGHLRGRWTKKQLKELVAFADNFGIEVIPCIQTLAHLERMLRWNCYRPLVDCENIMLIGDERVLAFIDKMFATAAECFTSRKINVGLDEAHMVGLGRYLDKNGYRNRSQLMVEHINAVCKIAEKYGFEPMMWSDMFFRLQFNDHYIVSEGSISEEVINTVPQKMTIVYWDYHTNDRKTLANMLSCHKQFKNKTMFAGSVQRYNRLTACNGYSTAVSEVQLDECFNYGVNDIMFTSWSSPNTETSHYYAIPTFTMYADKCYKADYDREWLDRHIENVFKISAKPFYAMDSIDYLPDAKRLDRGESRYSRYLIYSDILTGLHYKHIDRDMFYDHYTALAKEFEVYASNKNFGYVFKNMKNIATVCALRSVLIKDIRDSYTAGDKAKLRNIAQIKIPEAVRAMDDLIESMDVMWLKENRTNGMEVLQTQLGGCKERMKGVAKLLEMYCDGVIDAIDEMTDEPLFADCRDPESADALTVKRSACANWLEAVSVNRMI